MIRLWEHKFIVTLKEKRTFLQGAVFEPRHSPGVGVPVHSHHGPNARSGDGQREWFS